jgi:hypothetical protein
VAQMSQAFSGNLAMTVNLYYKAAVGGFLTFDPLSDLSFDMPDATACMLRYTGGPCLARVSVSGCYYRTTGGTVFRAMAHALGRRNGGTLVNGDELNTKSIQQNVWANQSASYAYTDLILLNNDDWFGPMFSCIGGSDTYRTGYVVSFEVQTIRSTQ